jgi:hypothetical protein
MNTDTNTPKQFKKPCFLWHAHEARITLSKYCATLSQIRLKRQLIQWSTLQQASDSLFLVMCGKSTCKQDRYTKNFMDTWSLLLDKKNFWLRHHNDHMRKVMRFVAEILKHPRITNWTPQPHPAKEESSSGRVCSIFSIITFSWRTDCVGEIN